MKFQLLRIIIMTIKYSAYGLVLQVVCMSLLFAHSTNAQYSSVKETHLNTSFRDKTLQEVFDLIEMNTDFSFYYNKKDLDKKIRLDIPKGDVNSVADVLFEISKKAKLKFKQVNNNISVTKIDTNSDFSSEKSLEVVLLADVDISGKVTDENGEGLPGATILEKGTSNGVTSDLDGNYKLSVSEEATITISFVGYIAQEIVVGSQSTIDLQMTPDAQQLDELVVVGYGTQKKSLLTNAVSQVSGDVINKSPTVSMANSLSGRLSGVFVTQNSSAPGSDDATISIRGSNTYRNNDALIVIDGVASVDGINRLDPNDIAKVTVLKDASAAIYGAQSAGGVILITTKRGESGKMKANYSFAQSFQSMAKVPDYASAVPYMQAVNSADILNGNAPSFPDALINNFSDGTRTSLLR